MTCTVTLSDSSFAAITSGKIEIEAFDPPSRSIDKKGNAALTSVSKPPGAHGAVLGVTATDIFDVIVHPGAGDFHRPRLITARCCAVLHDRCDRVRDQWAGASFTNGGKSLYSEPNLGDRSKAGDSHGHSDGPISEAAARNGASSFQCRLGGAEARILRELRIDPDLIE
jgi:hypothetical protein